MFVVVKLTNSPTGFLEENAQGNIWFTGLGMKITDLAFVQLATTATKMDLRNIVKWLKELKKKINVQAGKSLLRKTK